MPAKLLKTGAQFNHFEITTPNNRTLKRSLPRKQKFLISLCSILYSFPQEFQKLVSACSLTVSSMGINLQHLNHHPSRNLQCNCREIYISYIFTCNNTSILTYLQATELQGFWSWITKKKPNAICKLNTKYQHDFTP